MSYRFKSVVLFLKILVTLVLSRGYETKEKTIVGINILLTFQKLRHYTVEVSAKDSEIFIQINN